MTWLRFSLRCIFSTKNLPFFMKRKCENFTITFNFRKMDIINTWINDIVVHLDETLLGTILRVPQDGTRFVVGTRGSVEFVTLCSKHLTTKCAGLFKKGMKSEYQLVFEFVNKTLLPRTEKRTSTTSIDLYVMELLCKFEPLNLRYSCLNICTRISVSGKGCMV